MSSSGQALTGISDPKPALAMPVPTGVMAETGKTRQPWSREAVPPARAPLGVETARIEKKSILAVSATVTDPSDLKQTGWGVLFASDADPAIKAQLQPLLDLRKNQVGSDKLFQVFEGAASGVRPKQSAGNWAAARGVSAVAPIDPTRGVPFYLLIVGSLDRIPYEFQALLDLQWAVGRLHFDKLEDYGAYAKSIVQYETAKTIAGKKRVAMWMPKNPMDGATPMLHATIAPGFMGQTDGGKKLGSAQGFELLSYLAEGQATKANLKELLTGATTGGAASIIFTASHGGEWPMSNPEVQRAKQGALVTQEWTYGQPLEPQHYFAAEDLPDTANLQGSIIFHFACFGCGCPAQDNFFKTNDNKPIQLAPSPLVSQLPQKLLSKGALAVIGHVDRAFSYGFQDEAGTPQPQLLRSPLELLMQGKRAGEAMDPMNLQWSSLAAILGLQTGGFGTEPPPEVLANLIVARDDARNYMLLGDPAVRLRIQDLQ